MERLTRQEILDARIRERKREMERLAANLSRACMDVNDVILEVKDEVKRAELLSQLETLEASVREAIQESK